MEASEYYWAGRCGSTLSIVIDYIPETPKLSQLIGPTCWVWVGSGHIFIILTEDRWDLGWLIKKKNELAFWYKNQNIEFLNLLRTLKDTSNQFMFLQAPSCPVSIFYLCLHASEKQRNQTTNISLIFFPLRLWVHSKRFETVWKRVGLFSVTDGADVGLVG